MRAAVYEARRIAPLHLHPGPNWRRPDLRISNCRAKSGAIGHGMLHRINRGGVSGYNDPKRSITAGTGLKNRRRLLNQHIRGSRYCIFLDARLTHVMLRLGGDDCLA